MKKETYELAKRETTRLSLRFIGYLIIMLGYSIFINLINFDGVESNFGQVGIAIVISLVFIGQLIIIFFACKTLYEMMKLFLHLISRLFH